ncbi:MAG TPA: hypothetical protein DCY35_03845 [Prolixibacteraceae bacterium]|nr:hypothetical protein [Prolixibacteraceae bacterium]
MLFFTLTVLYLSVQTRPVQSLIAQKLTAYLSEETGINIHIGGIDVALFRRIILIDIWMEDQNADTLAYATRLSATIESLKFNNKALDISRLTLDDARIIIRQDSMGVMNYAFLSQLQKAKDNADDKWTIACNRFILRNSTFGYESVVEQLREITIDEVRMRIDQFSFTPGHMSFQLFSMSLNDRKGFYLNGLSAKVEQIESDFFIRDLSLETFNSVIKSSEISIVKDTLPGSNESFNQFDINLDPSSVSLRDLALFIPDLEGMDQQLEVSGKISGNLENIRARDLEIKTGMNTRIACDFSMSYLPGFGEPFFFVDFRQSQTNFTDIANIRLPSGMNIEKLRFPDQLIRAGNLTYKGNFTGFLSDFVAFGTITSRMGTLTTDIAISPESQNEIRYKGQLKTEGFNLARLIQSPKLGQISLNGMVNGTFKKNGESVNGDFDGVISRWLLNDYVYNNITMDGHLNNRKFDGNIMVEDPNLQMHFAGSLDLNEKIPVFDFIMHLGKADLVALKLDSTQAVSEIRLDMAANFSGNNIDNMEGLIQLFNGKYLNQNDTLAFENLIINTHLEEAESRINITSDYADLSVRGTYNFKSLIESFRIVLANYIPALRKPFSTQDFENQFTLNLDVKNLDDITAVFIPGMHIDTPFNLMGEIDTKNKLFTFNGNIPGISWNDFRLQDIGLAVQPVPGELTSHVSISEVRYEDTRLHNLDLLVDASNNTLDTRLLWNNKNENRYSGNISMAVLINQNDSTGNPVFRMNVAPSEIIISDTVWTIGPATFTIDTTSIHVQDFRFAHGNQSFEASGKISSNTEDQLSLTFANLDIESLDTYLQKSLGMKGQISGSLGVFDFYRSRIFYSDLRVDDFTFRNEEIGDISIVNKWDRETSLIDTEVLIVHNGRSNFTARGYFNPFSQNLQYTLNADRFPLGLLGTVIRTTFSNFHGDGSGQIVVSGTPKKFLMDGAVYAENAGLTIDFTQVSYHLNDSIRFTNDVIHFDRIEMKDVLGNRGIFNGTIRHDNFKNMDYNLTVTSNRILAMNTTGRHNDSFYGRVEARGNVRIQGKGTDVRLAGEATTLPGTEITIVLGDEEEVTRYDFVRFITNEQQPVTISRQAPAASAGGLEIDLTITATPDAQAQMIYNTQITDVIRARGEGVIRIRMDQDANMSLYGNYSVSEGEYLFTLQNVINKRFSIEPGGSIVWSGDPYNAIIDISAVYRLKASLRELYMGSMRTDIDYTQRIPVECKILLTDDLISPEINFDIVLPTVEDRIRDEIRQYFAAQEDLNRQMLSLLVLGQFYTPDYMRGTYEATSSNLIGNTASDLFSNQLSNWLSQINRDIDIGVNYRPGNQLTDDEIELALSTQIFNDRVIINGNIGNNANPNSVNNSELVGDFDLIVKLTPNGKLQLKAYNRGNNNLIYETAPYTQGIGISYKEEYNTFGELWRKFLEIFKN